MSTFSFSTTIPAANNDPADDQPLMLINNASTSGLISVDHVGFNIPHGGYHEQVTFNANQSAPGIGSGTSVAYCNSANGIFGNISSLFFQNATKNLQLTNLALVTNSTGSGFLTPWGIILNFGTAQTSGSTLAVTFAVPMTTLSSIVVSPISGSSSANVVASSPTNTGFTALANGGGTFFSFIAIGI